MDHMDQPASSSQGPAREPSLLKALALPSPGAEKMGRYNVFLSSDEDTPAAAFTSHLYFSLTDAGITVFKGDVNLPKGNSISTQLPFGIEHSTISLIIFSKDYAGSKWCLNELSNVMELHRAQDQVILPVFYGVDPGDVRHQSSDFGDTFEDLIQRISPPYDQVMRWKIDLRDVADIFGFVVLNSRNESEDIQRIVRRVSEILDEKYMFIIAKHPVGVNSRTQDLIRISENDPPNDVRKWEVGGFDSKYDRTRYDVFVSYKYADVRASLVAHLYSSLSDAEIVAFKDDDDDSLKGLSIFAELACGIERSTISIVIFSRNYAGSRFCLYELSKIMDLHSAQGLVVLPVFYGVDPSDVCHQSSSFGEAYLKIKTSESEEVSKWGAALRQAADLPGFVVNSRHLRDFNKIASQLIDRINAHLYNTRIRASVPNQQSMNNFLPFNPTRGYQAAPPNQFSGQHNNGQKSVEDMVLDILHLPSNRAKEEGVSQDLIAQHLGIPLDKLMLSIEKLIEEGAIYEAIADHYKSIING